MITFVSFIASFEKGVLRAAVGESRFPVVRRGRELEESRTPRVPREWSLSRSQRI